MLDEFSKERSRFGEHGVAKILAIFGIERAVWCRQIDLSQVQPLIQKMVDEPLRFRVREHSIHLGMQDVRPPQVLPTCECEKFLVGHRIPKKIGQSGGQRPVIQWPRAGRQKQKFWRAQRPLQRSLDGRFKGVSLLDPPPHHRRVGSNFRGRCRASKCTREKSGDHVLCVRGWSGAF